MTVLEGQALLDQGKLIARRYARRIGPEAAEELKAEAILRALASPPPDGRMEPWLERIYRNLTVDLWRRASGRRDADGTSVDDLPDEGTPEEAALRRERRRIVRAALADLPRDARRALLAKFYGESHDDVAADRFGVAAATVRTRIHRALARLRVRLADLQGCFPTLFGRVGSQLMAAGTAPAMVAALLVVSNLPAAPEPQLASFVVLAASAPGAARPTESAEKPASDSSSAAPARVRVSKHAAVKPPVAQSAFVVDIAPSPLVVAHIESPDALVVFADPEPPSSPCLVEAPASFATKIAQTVEDML